MHGASMTERSTGGNPAGPRHITETLSDTSHPLNLERDHCHIWGLRLPSRAGLGIQSV